MNLTIDGRNVTARPGQSLKDIICQLGIAGSTMTDRPIAARIAGEEVGS